MKETVKNIAKIIAVYIGYLILTVIFFYVTGMYVWNMLPTKTALIRMLILPLILTVATAFFTRKFESET